MPTHLSTQLQKYLQYVPATIAILGFGTILYFFNDIVILLFLAFILSNTLEPVVSKIEKFGIPRVVVILFLITLFLSIVSGLVYFLAPSLINQFELFITEFPTILERLIVTIGNFFGLELTPKIDFSTVISSLDASISNLSQAAFNVTSEIASLLVLLLSFLVIAFYMILDKKQIKSFVVNLAPSSKAQYMDNLWHKIETKLGAWFRGELTLIFCMGVYTFTILNVTGLSEFALALTVFACLLELVPLAGSTFSLFVGTLIGFNQSPLTGLLVFALLVVGQQIQGNLILPKVMKENIGLHPIVIIVALLVGSKLFGAAGVLIAVPVTALLSIIYQDWMDSKTTSNL